VNRSAGAGLALVLALAGGCAGWRTDSEPPAPYRPDRRDYQEFRAAHPDLLEPNYLPFMVHRVPGAGGGDDALVICRWPLSVMPLPVFIETPDIPETLQDEFRPRDPAGFVAAVEEALDLWERDLEGLVRFERVGVPGEAGLVLALVGEEAPAPEPDLQVLGLTPVARACRVEGFDPEAGRFQVDFSVPRVEIYVADRFGLLSGDQVAWIALHEIGHALGMRHHSPIPADLMYAVVRDRVTVSELSIEDVNSFVNLYQLPNGTVFGSVTSGEATSRRPLEPPSGEPTLSMAPFVDSRLGFAVRPPQDWMRLETSHGMVAIDGVTWDYTASFQVVVQRFASIEEYLERYAAYYLSRGPIARNEFTEVAGRRTLAIALEDLEERRVEQLFFIEAGDGRIVVVIADAPSEMAAAYQPWFQATLDSLEIWSDPP
jgi:hypothetical protein